MKENSKQRNTKNSESTNSKPFFNLSEKSKESKFFDQNNASPFFTVQPKLSIGQSNDKYEQEADAIADQIVNESKTPGSVKTVSQKIQTKCADCEEEEVRTNPEIQKQEEEEEMLQMQPEEEEEELQMKPSNDQASVSTQGFESSLKSKSGSGESLPNGIKQEMEQSFGADFSNVNIHKNTEAEQLSSSINAQAFAHGNDIFFNKGKYNPNTKGGKHLLAHELTHVLQQQSNLQKSSDLISRVCAAGTDKTWAEKVTEMESLSGDDKNTCAVSMINEALGGSPPVHQSTNNAADLEAAITAGHYTAWGSGQDINFDANFNAKTGNPNQFGEARYVTNGSTTTIYIIMGPGAIGSVGPELTQMAHQHEAGHAADYTSQAANGSPHSATQGEELSIYTRGFTGFFLSLTSLDTSACSYSFADDFSMMFNTYTGATDAEKDSAFSSIESYYNNSIKGNNENEMKFKLWFQSILNNRGASDSLVTRVNALDGLGLSEGTETTDHLVC